MDEWNFWFPGSLFIVGLYIKVLRIWEWIWSLLKLSKVRLTASYSKIAMKPSSPEMWTSLDYRWKQVIFKCSSKQVKKKKWNVCHIQSCQDIASSRYGASQLEIFTCIASVLLTPKGHTLVFYLWPWQLPKNIYCHCLCKLQILSASPNLLPLHKTPIRSYPVCQQALGICAERYNSPQILQERNWMHFSDGHIVTKIWCPHLHKNGVS